MNIMYICDDSFAYIAGISMLSLLENNKRAESINIYLVNDNISPDNIYKLQKTVSSFNRKLILINAPNIKKIVDIEIKTHHWTENVFARIFLNMVLGNNPEIERLIYIDSDTLVIGDLTELWETNLKGKILAGVLEAMGDLHKKAIGLSKEAPYINSGVILFDVAQWKKNNYDKRAAEFIQKANGNLEYPDEGVLNGIASNNMMILSPKFNFTSLSTYFSLKEVVLYRKPSFHYSEEEMNVAKSDIRIVHFTSTFMDVRPWVKGCKHPYAEKWNEYKNKSLWSNISLQDDNRSKMEIIRNKCALRLPLKLRLILAGFVHAYVKPLKYIK